MAKCALCNENQITSDKKNREGKPHQDHLENPDNQGNSAAQGKSATKLIQGNRSNWCERCKVVTEGILGEIVWKMPTKWANTRMCNLLQPILDKPKSVKISRIIEEFSSTNDVRWALLDEDKTALKKSSIGNPRGLISTQISPAHARKLLGDWKQYFSHLPLSRQATKHELRVLQRGVELHDGTILSIAGKMIFLDGEVLPGNFPATALSRAMTRRPKGGLAPTRFDWPKLIPTMSVLIDDENLKLSERQATTVARLVNARDTAFRHIVLTKSSGSDLLLNRNPLSGVMRWLSWCLPDLAEEKIRPIYRQPNSHYQYFNHRHTYLQSQTPIEGFHIHANDWVEGLDGNVPWVNRWRKVGKEGVESLDDSRSPLCTRRGAILLRILNHDGRWIRTTLPHDPRLWALLTSWALSPPASRHHNLFMALRWNWKNPRPELSLSEPEVRALALLRDVCRDNHDRVRIQDRKIMIRGRSGCAYAVDAKDGVHNAPFSILGWPHPTDQSNGVRGRNLCIHTGQRRRKIPLGDVIASVVLSLLDDIGSAQRIDSLHQFLFEAENPEYAHRHRDNRHPLRGNPEWRQYYRQQRQNLGQIRDYWRNNAEQWPDFQLRLADAEDGRRNADDVGHADLIHNIEVRAPQPPQPPHAPPVPRVRGRRGPAEVPEAEFAPNPNDGGNEGDNAEAEAGIYVDIVANPPYGAGNPEVELRGQFLGRAIRDDAEEVDRFRELVRNEEAFRELEFAGNLQVGPVGNRTPRWTTLFPLLSRVLQALPAMEEMTIPRDGGGLLQFVGCGFQMNIRSDAEKEYIRQLAVVLGWGRIDDDDQVNAEAACELEGADHLETWRRERTPAEGALAQISRLLRPLQEQFGMHGEAPWWWAYRRIRHDLPQELHLTWDMELSYADIGDDHADLIA